MRVQVIKMKALQILAASALILATAGPSTVHAEQRVIENREVIQTTQTLPFKLVGGVINLAF